MESFSGSQYGKGMEKLCASGGDACGFDDGKIHPSGAFCRACRAGAGVRGGCTARGLSENRILFGNVLKSVLLRMVTLLFLSAGSLLGGTAIVETIFMWNGVGKMAVDAVSMHDIPVIQAYLVWMAAIYLLLHLIADLLMGALDPRAKLEGMR